MYGFSVDDERKFTRLPLPQSGRSTFALGTPFWLKKPVVTNL